MPLVRTYQCDACTERLGLPANAPFRFDKLHFSRDEPPPECPGCQVSAMQVPAGATARTNKGRAMDIAQDVMENDLGLSNFKDNLREGDTAIITPPHLAPAVKGFFSPPGQIIAAAKEGAKAAAAEGSNPISMVQRASKTRNFEKHRVPVSVVARK